MPRYSLMRLMGIVTAAAALFGLLRLITTHSLWNAVLTGFGLFALLWGSILATALSFLPFDATRVKQDAYAVQRWRGRLFWIVLPIALLTGVATYISTISKLLDNF